MAGSTVIPLSTTSQSIFREYLQTTYNIHAQDLSHRRTRMGKIDRLYQREVDKTAEQQNAAAANLRGDSNRLQNITVPVIMPQVETAVAHQTSVFLTEQPLFDVVSTPEFIDSALAMATVIDEQATRGKWVAQFMNMFRSGSKHNMGAVEVSWVTEKTLALDTDVTLNKNEGIPTEVLWSGNQVKWLNNYNLILDPRVDPVECYKDGEFAGYWERMTRLKFKSFLEALPDKIVANVRPALESGIGTGIPGAEDSNAFFTPDINPEMTSEVANSSGTNWESWAGLSKSAREKGIDYKDMYEITTLYCRILPSEFELIVPHSNTPQVYRVIFVNHEHIIYCERQTNAHTWLPILVGRPTEDGTGKQSKSLAKNAEPFQSVTSAMMNSVIASRRRAISDRCLFDPSRITSAQINNPNPSAKIPVRPAAYGKNISDAVYRFDYREDQAANSLMQIQQLLGLSNQLSGQNPASQGQFVKGNKTSDQWQDVMQHASSRDHMASLLWESQVFTPLKHILKINILQYQGGTTLYNRDKQVAVEVDPVRLRKSVMDFKVADGLVPNSKLVNSDILSVAFQVLGSSPEIGAGYNLAPMFSYLMKSQGARIAEFEKSPEQQAYEQAMGQWQQLAQLAIDKGAEFAAPQPQPEQFGYAPAGPAPTAKTAESTQLPTVEEQA